ncbi:MAG: Hsp20/alpha crystallin family protein [Bacteroidia bacterium]
MNNLSFMPQRKVFNHPLFSNVLPSFLDEAIGRETAAFMPAVNIAEEDKSWNIEVSAPGFKKEDFKIRIENDTLTISAEHKEEKVSAEKPENEKQTKEKNYSRREFRYGSFSRSFRLPKEKVNEEAINATYENGILNLTIPKKEVAVKEIKEIRVA